MLATFAVLVGLLQPGGAATLEISVTPRSATIEVDGKAQRLNIGGKISVAPGTHRVTAKADGHRSETRNVNAAAGKSTKVRFALVAAGPAKSPVVVKTPVGGRPIGKQPVTKQPVAKQPVAKQPVAKQPVTKQPVAKEPVAKRPIATNKPVAKKPVDTNRPVADKPTVAKKPTTGVATRPKTVNRPDTTRPVSGGTGVGGSTPVAGERRPMSTKPFAVLSWIVGGVAITGGVLAGMESQGFADQFNDSVNRREKQGFKTDAENWALGSNVLYGVGATAVVVGALLWALDPADSYGAQVAPLPGGGAYVGFGGSF